ncbi:MAG: hypothetical protein E6G09_00505 [Actinobacteria bacterium]|nr:MAG: hypothetical protein E6G09_00505 [Actinomycetota bacterium]
MRVRTQVLLLVLLATVVAVSSALALGDPKRFTVTSTLDGKTVLPLRIRWRARPQHVALAQVKEVDYLIDGRRAWTEHHAPYYYGSNEGAYGNWLVSSFLTPGEHTFVVRAVTRNGRIATDTVKARVLAAPAPPAKLAGPWTRIVKRSDLKKGPPGPPAGRWTITVSSVGWATGPGDNFDVRYLPSGDVVMGPEVVTPTQQTGAFCGVDPLHEWKVALSVDDQNMTLDPVGHDGCGDRVAILQGTWTRVH